MKKTLTGAEHEINFWRSFVKTERFLKGWVGEGRTPELRTDVADFLFKHVPQGTQILDVGSGVVSILNGLHYQIISADPLGEEYAKIFDYDAYGLKAPLPHTAEELPFDNEFQVVHMSNAIDHSIDPVRAFESLKRAMKKGGHVILQGFFNEGTYENWRGMHQWNIYVEKNVLWVEDRAGDRRMIDQKPHKVIIYELNSKKWYVWIQKK